MSDAEAPAASAPAERQTETKTATSRKRSGRPSKSRGAAKSSDSAEDRWTVRGVPGNVRKLAVANAEGRGMPVGDWVSEAVVAYSKSDKSGVSADGHGGLPAVERPPDLVVEFKAIQDRLTQIERKQSQGWFRRIFGSRE